LNTLRPPVSAPPQPFETLLTSASEGVLSRPVNQGSTRMPSVSHGTALITLT
jgi:hypothetical protein